MVVSTLETSRLVIREIEDADALAFHEYMQLEDYWRHIPMDPPTQESTAARVRRWSLARSHEPRKDFYLAVTEKPPGKVVGEALLFVRSVEWRQGEIGWGLSADRAGRGLGTEIGAAMLRLAFGALHLHRVYAQCRVENFASRRIMEKLGMREEGVLRENVFARGSWWSSVQCSILATEYVGRPPEK